NSTRGAAPADGTRTPSSAPTAGKRSRKKSKGKKRSRSWRRKYLPLKPKSIQRKVRSDISKNLSTISKQNWKRLRKDSQNLKNPSKMNTTAPRPYTHQGMIRTFTGIYVDVFDPTPEMICIEDIAHALAHQCRFAGHVKRFYSVAQHSVMCSRMVDRLYQMEALLHDASEAYLLDIPKPIKEKIVGYKEMEDRMMGLIA